MAEVHEHEKAEQPFGMPRWVTALLPLVLLALIVGGFVVADPLSDLREGQPLPDVTITNAELPNDETIIVHVTNNGPEEVTISQVLVDEAYWAHEFVNGDNTLGRGESVAIRIPYHWNQGADHEVTLVLSDGATFSHTIVGAQRTVGLNLDILIDLALMGLFVGVIPVALGMLWFPYIRSMTERWLHAVLAFSVGVLAFLMFDAGFEALEIAEDVPGIFDGKIIIVLGTLGALLLVQSVSSWREGRESSGDTRAGSGLWIAYLVALGIGLHNLAEGLAIGSSFALGRVSLGAFLVIGFMVHNVTEGPAVVAPLASGERPKLAHFGLLGLIAGAPVILGGWIGGFAFSPTVGVFFLAIGVGAILQVTWEISKMIKSESGRVATPLNLIGFLVGLVVMYATDLLVAV